MHWTGCTCYQSTHLPSRVAVVELVLVPVSKLLREPLLNLFVCELFALALQEGEGNGGQEGEGNGGWEGETHLRTYVLVQMYVHAYVDTADAGSGR